MRKLDLHTKRREEETAAKLSEVYMITDILKTLQDTDNSLKVVCKALYLHPADKSLEYCINMMV